MAQYTITINDETAIGKSLLNLIKSLAEDVNVVQVDKSNSLLNKMRRNRQGDFLSEAEKKDFVNSLK